MLEFDRFDVSEGIDANKTNAWKECDIYHYFYFLGKGFKYEPYLFNGCHDLMQKAMNFNDVNDAIVSFKGNDYRIHFWCMSKDEKFWFKWKVWIIINFFNTKRGWQNYSLSNK